MKNKTAAAWLTFVGGPLGLHRYYLFGFSDTLGRLLPIPTLLGLYGLLRARHYGVDDFWSTLLLPCLGLTVAGCALNAIVYGLMEKEKWNARFNPGVALDHRCGETRWLTVAAIVPALAIGATALLASIALCFQRYFEYQPEARAADQVIRQAQNTNKLTQYPQAATNALAGMVKIQAQTILPATPRRTPLAR
jgi:hypothetical protein